MNTLAQRLTGAVLWLMVGLSTAQAEPVALVTDMTGTATLGEEALAILTELEVGSEVTVSDGAGLSVVFYHTGTEYRYAGPARFKTEAQGPHHLSGKEPETEAVVPEGNGSISTVGIAQAAMVMRASPNEPILVLLSPVETILLDLPEAFHWQALEGDVGYSFELTDPEGRTLMETTVTGSSLDLSESLELVPGEYYSWFLETRLPDGNKFSNWASFSVADDDLKGEVARRRPARPDNVSQLVLYALWLEQNELFEEARRTWARVDALRPNSANVKARIDPGL